MQSLTNLFNGLILRLRSPEVYVISYPKTGRTWLRALLGKALCEMNDLGEERILDTEYVTSASGVSLATFSHDGSEMSAGRSYKELSADKSHYADKKVIILVRDVRDTIVSAYFQATKRIFVFEESLSSFIRSDRYGVKKILTFYNNWYINKDVPNDFLFIRYEQIHENPGLILEQSLKFLGMEEMDREATQKAVNFSSFNNLKRLESENYFKSPRLAPIDNNDNESYKVRSGQVGGYREYLSAKDVQYIDELVSELGCEFTFSQLDS